MPCGTPDHLTDFLSMERIPVAPPTTELVNHEAHGSIPNVRFSDRFALKWGPSFTLSEEDAQRILNDFEFSHAAEVSEWEMDDPTGVGGTYFNVYIGDSGGVVPSAFGNAGYFTTDAFGYPMIVLNKDLLGDATYIRSVIAHEFFHAVQYASGSYYDWTTGAWYWEATATWAQGEVVPESDAYAGFLVFYALQPHVGLYHHSMTDFGGEPPDLHQYGAFIFPRFLSEHMASGHAVLDSWRSGTESGDPVRFLRDYLTEPLFNAALVDHGAHNLTWDYSDKAMYESWVNGYAEWWPEADYRANQLFETDDPDWYAPSDSLTLAAASYATVQVPDGWADDGFLTVRIEASGPLSEATDCSLIGHIVKLEEGVPDYIPLSHTAVHDTAEVGTDGELWLTVANASTTDECPSPTPFKVSFLRRDDPIDTGSPPDTGDEPDTGSPTEDYGYPDAQEDTATNTAPSDVATRNDTEPSPKGCSCSSQPAPPPWLWATLPLILYRRRGSAGA